jgi:pimeloyl-ACP methyl ester carboxylesterase
MIEEPRGRIDYGECGSGPTIVLVPGSCRTAAACRPVIASWNDQFRCVTTSLLGYGGTVEFRTASDPDIADEAEMLESVVREVGSRVHLVGHSFGGLVALAVALRNRVSLASLVILEAPAPEVLRDCGEHEHYSAFRQMTEGYFTGGNAEAIAAMIDFTPAPALMPRGHPGCGPYVVETTAVNILDWASAYGFALSAASLAAVQIPALVIRGACVGTGWRRRTPARRHHPPPQVLPPWLSRQARAEGLQLRYRRGDNHFEQRCLVRYSPQAASVAREVRYHS